MQSNIFNLFSVPLVQIVHPQPQILNTELKKLILEKESRGQPEKNPSPSMRIPEQLFESKFDFFSQSEPCVVQLRKFCMSWLLRSIGEMSGYDAAQLGALEVNSHTWFHVTRKGGYFPLHNHPMASWSGVYCVAPGNAAPGNASDGAISFLNPMGLANMFVDAGNCQVKPPFSGKNFSLQLRAGELVLFPSYLFHEVFPYSGSEERITVAFNCWFTSANP